MELSKVKLKCHVCASLRLHSISDLAEIFSVSRATVYRTLQRDQSA
ncbi:helix-turn-helix domain-containing protein [Ruegeria sp.]